MEGKRREWQQGRAAAFFSIFKPYRPIMFSKVVCWLGLHWNTRHIQIIKAYNIKHNAKQNQFPFYKSPAYRVKLLNKSGEVNMYFLVWDCAGNKYVNGWMGTGGRLAVDCCRFSAWLCASWGYSYSTLTSFSHTGLLGSSSLLLSANWFICVIVQ